MKPASFADVDGEIVEIHADAEHFLVWLKPPDRDPLAFDATTARALAYALLSAADAARFPRTPKKEE